MWKRFPTWWYKFWQPRLTKDDLQLVIETMSTEIMYLRDANKQNLFEAIKQLEQTSPITVDFNRYDLYKAAALTGLLARAGVVGGPEHNKNFVEWSDAWAKELLK
jgi:hypothetical protein